MKQNLFYFLLLVFLFASPALLAQNKHRKTPRLHHHLALGVGAWKKEKAISLQWFSLYGLGRSQKFKIGPGLRYTWYKGKEREYTSAPPELARDEARKDTVVFFKPHLSSLNLGLYMSFDLAPRWTLGLNTDFLGITFGKKAKAGILYSTTLDSLAVPVIGNAAKRNLFLVEDNSFGALNSEIYLEYHISRKLRVKAGVLRYFSEYRTILKLTEDNDRFRRIAPLLTLGLTWTPFTENVKCPKKQKVKVKKLKEGEF